MDLGYQKKFRRYFRVTNSREERLESEIKEM